MPIFTRSPEYRKQGRTSFLVNKAQVRKEIDQAAVVASVHEPALQIISPTETTVILPNAMASTSVGTTGVTVTGGAQAGLAVFDEDFSSYVDSTAWRADSINQYTGIFSPGAHFIDTSITDPEVTTSTQSLRLEYETGTCGSSNVGFEIGKWQDGRIIEDISPDVTEIWVEMRMRFDSAWNTNDTGSCAEVENHQLLAALVSGVGAQGQHPFFQLRDGAGPNSFWNISAPPDDLGQSQGEDSDDSLPNSDNTWNVIRCNFKLSEVTKTIPDGRAFFELNGKRLVGRNTGFDGEDIITAAVDPLGSGETYNNFTHIQFAGELKPLKTTPIQKLWISRVRVFDQDPGWAPDLPNLPEGAWVNLIDRPFDALDETGTTGFAMTDTPSSMGNADFISGDGTNPQSGAGMMRINYTLGLTPGTAPINTEFDFADTHNISTPADPKKECYVAYWYRISSNYFGKGVNKMMFIFAKRTDNSQKPSTFCGTSGTGDVSPLNFEIRLQNLLGDSVAGGGGSRNLTANVTSAPVIRDTWVFLEMYFRLNDVGSENGEAHAWIDGVKRIEYTNISWDDGSLGGSDNVQRFSIYKLNPTWGGIDPPNNPVNSFWDIDHLVFKVR